MRMRWRSALGALAAIAVLGVAAVMLWNDARGLGAARLHAAWNAVPLHARWGCAAFTTLSFGCLGAIERLAARRALPGRIGGARAVAAGVVSHALANTFGLHALTAPGTRMLLYRRARPSPRDIARILAAVAGSLVSGVGVCAVLAAATLAGGVLAGAVAALGLTAALAFAHRRGAVGHRLLAMLPAPASVALAVAESALAMAALYVLLPTDASLSPARFVLAFAASAALGVVSHAPGGIGVFEASMLAALPGDDASVLGALLWFRVIYNLIPCALAAPAFGLLQLQFAGTVSVGRWIQRDRALLPQVEPRELA